MRKLISLVLTLLIMAFLFSRINFSEFKGYLRTANLALLLAAIFCFVPQILITSFRWKLMIWKKAQISLLESARLILAANALNILLPSRVGDLSKAYFLGKRDALEIKRGFNIVLFEKYIDLFSLSWVMLTGIVLSFPWDRMSLLGGVSALLFIGTLPVLFFVKLDRWVSHSWFEKGRLLLKLKRFLLDSQEYLNELKADGRHLVSVLGLSILLWFVHLLQFYVFFLALHSEVSFTNVFRLVPLAIFVGLVPLTIAGVGTRDSALIILFSPYEKASLMLGVGLFSSLRYFVPGLLGLPFLNHYLVKGRLRFASPPPALALRARTGTAPASPAKPGEASAVKGNSPA